MVTGGWRGGSMGVWWEWRKHEEARCCCSCCSSPSKWRTGPTSVSQSWWMTVVAMLSFRDLWLGHMVIETTDDFRNMLCWIWTYQTGRKSDWPSDFPDFHMEKLKLNKVNELTFVCFVSLNYFFLPPFSIPGVSRRLCVLGSFRR